MGTPVGNSVGNAIERRPSVLYSFIGERPMGGQSIDVEGAAGVPDANRLISSVSVREFGSEKTKDEVSIWECIEGVASSVVGEGSWRSGPGVVAW